MAALAHLGVGLAAKPLAPGINVGLLIFGAYALDFLWWGFSAAGLDSPLSAGAAGHPAYWDHSLLMGTVWSVLAGLIAAWIGHKGRTGVVFGLVVFSHWVVDFITHPMTAMMPGDRGLPLGFSDSPLIGLGLYSTKAGAWGTEIGSVVVGLGIYIVWRVRRGGRKKAAAATA